MEDKSLIRAIELYGRILDDLEDLARTGEVSPALYQTIKEFYARRKEEKKAQEEARQRAADIETCIRSARSRASSGQLPIALAGLKADIKNFPEEKVLQEMALEIDGQIRERQQAQRVAKILAAARIRSRNSRFQEARDTLQEALALDPGNREITDELERVRSAADEYERRALTAARISLRDSRFQEAQDTLKKALALDPNNKELAAELDKIQSLIQQEERRAAVAEPAAEPAPVKEPAPMVAPAPSFAEEEEIPSPTQRFIEATSREFQLLKPFLLDNVGWFVGAFLIIAGFVVLITTLWNTIGENPILMRSLLFFALLGFTGLFFALAYFMRLKRPELETSSNVLLVVVSLLVPLVFAAATLITLIPSSGSF